MNAQSLPLTGALSDLASEHGVDLTRFAAGELLCEQMFEALLARDYEAFDRASERFDEAMKERENGR